MNANLWTTLSLFFDCGKKLFLTQMYLLHLPFVSTQLFSKLILCECVVYMCVCSFGLSVCVCVSEWLYFLNFEYKLKFFQKIIEIFQIVMIRQWKQSSKLPKHTMLTIFMQQLSNQMTALNALRIG